MTGRGRLGTPAHRTSPPRRDRRHCLKRFVTLSLTASTASMPRAIISPSVLASDFGQLTAECQRMIKGGAEWLHMGASAYRSRDELELTASSPSAYRCDGRVCARAHTSSAAATLTLIASDASHFVPNITMGRHPRSHLSLMPSGLTIPHQAHPSCPASPKAFQASSWTCT